jgi:phage tail-like protein
VAIDNRTDPYLGFNFVVEIDGIVLGGFSEVSGLQVEIEIQTFREGGVNQYMRQLPGPAKYPSNLIFKRGLTDDEAFAGRWNVRTDPWCCGMPRARSNGAGIFRTHFR